LREVRFASRDEVTTCHEEGIKHSFLICNGVFSEGLECLGLLGEILTPEEPDHPLELFPLHNLFSPMIQSHKLPQQPPGKCHKMLSLLIPLSQNLTKIPCLILHNFLQLSPKHHHQLLGLHIGHFFVMVHYTLDCVVAGVVQKEIFG
jgi:hypothetical protein